jgi:hypothetical protein
MRRLKPRRPGGGGITPIKSIAEGPRGLNALPPVAVRMLSSTRDTIFPFESLAVLSSKKKEPAYVSSVEPSLFLQCCEGTTTSSTHNNNISFKQQSSTILQEDEEKIGSSWELDECSFDYRSDIILDGEDDSSCLFSMDPDNDDSYAAAGVGMPFDDNKLPPADIIDEIISTFRKSSNPPPLLETTNSGGIATGLR